LFSIVKEAPIYQDSRLEIEEIPNLKHQIPSIQPSAFIFLVCSEVDGWLLTTGYWLLTTYVYT